MRLRTHRAILAHIVHNYPEELRSLPPFAPEPLEGTHAQEHTLAGLVDEILERADEGGIETIDEAEARRMVREAARIVQSGAVIYSEPERRGRWKRLEDVPQEYRNRYREGAWRFDPPPVCTDAWAELDWLNFIFKR